MMPRSKTGVCQTFRLWPETLAALERVRLHRSELIARMAKTTTAIPAVASILRREENFTLRGHNAFRNWGRLPMDLFSVLAQDSERATDDDDQRHPRIPLDHRLLLLALTWRCRLCQCRL